MRFTLEIACDNAAFGDDQYERCAEVAEILRRAVDRVGFGDNYEIGQEFWLRDSNGNKVGMFKFTNA